MEGLILLVGLLLAIIILFQGIVFGLIVLRIFNAELGGFKQVLPTKESGDSFTLASKEVPLDQFIPRGDIPVKVKYSEKDEFTKV